MVRHDFIEIEARVAELLNKGAISCRLIVMRVVVSIEFM